MHLGGVVASVGVSLLGVAHPTWENILGAGDTPRLRSFEAAIVTKADMWLLITLL